MRILNCTERLQILTYERAFLKHGQKWQWISHNARGGFAEYTTVHASGLFKLPQNGLGVDSVIETVGGGSNFNEALAVLRKRGVVVLVGGYFKPVSVDLWPVVFSEATVVGSFCYGYTGMKKDFQASIELIASAKIPVTKVITHRFLLDDIAEAFEVAANKRSGAIKVQIHQ